MHTYNLVLNDCWLQGSISNFRLKKRSIDDCNVQFSIICFLRIKQHSFLLFQKIDCWQQHSFFIFFVFEEAVDDCNVQFSIFCFLRINWWLQHSFFLFQRINWWLQHLLFIFLFSKKQLMTATFNFRSFVSYELIDDCNIQFPSVKQGRYWRYIWMSSLPVRNCED